jgi:CRISPR-associated protein Cas5t
MQALRIVLRQSSANYRKEETVDNKMTYPLPPLSTVIGALHVACGYKEYKPMDISIQGNFESMLKEPYTDYCFLNSIMNDRGILVKMKNSSLLSSAFTKVAAAKNSTGNDFRKEITIQVHNRDLLTEYQNLKNLADEIKKYKDTELKDKIFIMDEEIKLLKTEKKKLDKKSDEYKEKDDKEKEIKLAKDKLLLNQKNYETENYSEPISKFRSLTTSLKYYEILHNIELIVHVKADDEVLNTILENIYNLKSIGRSEDFVEVIEAKIIGLVQDYDCYKKSDFSAYLRYEDVVVKDESDIPKIYTKTKQNRDVNGTVYYMNKNYEIIDEQRIFNKKKVLYASNYEIDSTSDNVWLDVDDSKKDSVKRYIVNFV